MRVVYGDHGPYLELERGAVRWGELELRAEGRYYDLYRSRGVAQAYLQAQGVASVFFVVLVILQGVASVFLLTRAILVILHFCFWR